MGTNCGERKRREPETTVLYRIVLAEWHTFVQRVAAGERLVPRFCVREVEGYLRCGILGHGFARVHCAQCSAWSGLGSGTNNTVRSLAVSPAGELFAGGTFSLAGGQPAEALARWDGVAWNNVPSGPWRTTFAMAFAPNGELIASRSDQVTSATHVVQWNGSTWQSLGQAFGTVHDLRVRANGDLVIVGSLSQVGTTACAAIAQRTGGAWQAIPGLSTTTILEAVEVLGNGGVFVGGGFAEVAGAPAGNVARWDGSSWTALSSGTQGFDVTALAMRADDSILAGGRFTMIGGALANGLARYDGTSWQAITSGWSGQVQCFAEWQADLVVGGYARDPLQSPPEHVARWDGAAWHGLGSGVNGDVYAMRRLANGDLLLGGTFNAVGAQPASGLARWDGTTLQPFAIAVELTWPSIVRDIVELPSGELLVAGSFRWYCNGSYADNLARWTGSVWQPFGGGTNGNVMSLVRLANGDLVAGGSFSSAGGVACNRIARWDGATWQPLGAGLDNTVTRIVELPNGDLVVAGWFQYAGVWSRGIARWNGSAWTSCSGGVNGPALALARRSNGDVFVGGYFDIAGGNRAAPLLGVLSPTCPATADVLGTGCAGTGGQNVLAATALPWTGATFRAAGSGLLPGSLVGVTFGLSNPAASLAGISPLAGQSCMLLASPDSLVLTVAGAGPVSSSLAIPRSVGFAGVLLHHQMLALEPGPLGMPPLLTSTNALRLLIGQF